MTSTITFDEMCTSIETANNLRNECGVKFNAKVIVKHTEREMSQYFDCGIYIGHGQYSDHNMPYINVEWPSDKGDLYYDSYNCQYVKIKSCGHKAITIYSKTKDDEKIEIDVVCRR